MADFGQAFDYMLPHEDYSMSGKVEKDNNGFLVRYGINEQYHPGLDEFFTTMPADKALQFARILYQTWYWSPLNGIMMPDQNIANKAFDQSVPLGVAQAAKCLQRAVNDCVETGQLDVDGNIGHLTITQLYHLNGSEDLMDHFKSQLVITYKQIVAAKPQYAAYLQGWINRATL